MRLERFDEVLAGMETDLPTVEAQLAAWRQGADPEKAREARAFLEELCLHWNGEVRRQDRPAFGAFLDDVPREIDGPGWANRLRNRLGLSHHDVPEGGQPLAVALVHYPVAEVLAATGDGRTRAFAVPTVLDGELNAHFFPAPRGVGFGRTLDLEPDPDCERLVAEILHRRIDYAPEHLCKVGWVTAPIPPHARGSALARLRNGHLFCLRYESDREDFGEDMPEVDDG